MDSLADAPLAAKRGSGDQATRASVFRTRRTLTSDSTIASQAGFFQGQRGLWGAQVNTMSAEETVDHLRTCMRGRCRSCLRRVARLNEYSEPDLARATRPEM